jgi:hypothetical protein
LADEAEGDAAFQKERIPAFVPEWAIALLIPKPHPRQG